MAKLECEYKYTYTAKERQFCDNIALKGMTQYDAFCNAYTSKGWKREAIDVNASKLANSAKISLRIGQLRDTLQEKAIAKATWTMEESTELLKVLVADVMENKKFNAAKVITDTGEEVSYLALDAKGRASAVTSVIAELNKMYGYNKQNTVNETTIKMEKTLEDILCSQKNGQ